HLGAKTLRSAIEPFRTRRVLFPGARPERQIQCGVREGDFDQRWRIPAWDSDARPGAHPTPHRPGRTDWRCDLHSETMRPIRNVLANPVTDAERIDDSDRVIRCCPTGCRCC